MARQRRLPAGIGKDAKTYSSYLAPCYNLSMTTVVAFISQKGGVGKSTLARALAREAVISGLKVKIADLDPDQATIVDWHKVRTQRAIEPVLSVELFRNVAQALAGNRRA